MNKLQNKLKSFFDNLSLRSKLVALLFVAGIIPLLCVSVFSYSSAYKTAKEQSYRSLGSTNAQLANNIESLLEPIIQLSSLIYTDNFLRDVLCADYDEDIEFVNAYAYIDRYLYNLLVSNGNIQLITFYLENPSIPADGLFIRHFDESFPFDIRNYKNGESALRYLSTTSKKGVRMLLFGRPLDFETAGEPYGFLVIALRDSAIANLFASESAGDNVYVLTDRGEIVSSTHTDSLLLNISDLIVGFPQEQLNGTIETEINGVKSMVVYTTLSNGWKTVITTPMKQVYGSITASTSKNLIVALLCIALAFQLVLQISRYFSSRFSLLNQQITMVENNDFSFYIEPIGNDEMGKLGAALNKMARTLDNAINEGYRKEIKQKETELQLLQSQINPHLLYNALSGISSMALKSKDMPTSEFAKHLSQFYKLSLNRGQQFVSVENEIKTTVHYIEIQKTRFRDIFEFAWDKDSSVLQFMTPKLILQPFIENIINHAVRDDEGPVHTDISIKDTGENILFTVSDNGAGIAPETLKKLLDPEQSHGFGIPNVNARIKLYYGEKYGASVESSLNVGTTAYIIIPKNKFPEATIDQRR